jgi:hypothetical protein
MTETLRDHRARRAHNSSFVPQGSSKKSAGYGPVVSPSMRAAPISANRDCQAESTISDSTRNATRVLRPR